MVELILEILQWVLISGFGVVLWLVSDISIINRSRVNNHINRHTDDFVG